MIHKTSIIDKRAKISSDVKIGPYSIIGPDVEIDKEVENTQINQRLVEHFSPIVSPQKVLNMGN